MIKFKNDRNNMKKLLNICLIVSIFIGCGHSMEVEENNLLNNFPADIKTMIFEKAIVDQCYKFGHSTRMALVCKQWYELIKGDFQTEYVLDIPQKVKDFFLPRNLEEYFLFK